MAKTKFYHVQIAHWGWVPILNRRGPVADIELTAEQIGILRDEYHLTLLNPYTGKPFEFPTEIVPGAMSVAPSQTPKDANLPKIDPESEGDSAPAPTAEPEVADGGPEKEDPPKSDEVPYTTFDPKWFPDFDQLSKNKQKKLRARYADLLAECQKNFSGFGMIPDKLNEYLVELKERD